MWNLPAFKPQRMDCGYWDPSAFQVSEGPFSYVTHRTLHVGWGEPSPWVSFGINFSELEGKDQHTLIPKKWPKAEVGLELGASSTTVSIFSAKGATVAPEAYGLLVALLLSHFSSL